MQNFTCIRFFILNCLSRSTLTEKTQIIQKFNAFYLLAGKEKIFVQFALAYLPVITNSTNIKIFNKMYDNRITQATFNGKHFISLRVSDNVYSYTFNLKVLCYKNEPLYSYMYGNDTLVYLSSKILCKKLHKHQTIFMYVS